MEASSHTIKLELTEEFERVLEQAKQDFKQLHNELTDDIKKLIAEEVAKQLRANVRLVYRKPNLEVK